MTVARAAPGAKLNWRWQRALRRLRPCSRRSRRTRMTERELAPAFIDEPGPSSSLVEWQAFRDDLARSGIPHIEPILRQADLMIWFKEHGESLTPWEREVMEVT